MAWRAAHIGVLRSAWRFWLGNLKSKGTWENRASVDGESGRRKMQLVLMHWVVMVWSVV